jgi:uncharacterized protein
MMTNVRCVLAACVAFLLLAASAHGEADVPLLSGRITDNASLLSPETTARLSALLKSHEDSTSNQVAVLTIPSLEGEPIESYSIRVAETWKLGTKEKDNGVLLIVARDDRKVRIEVGRGLEGNLPDITAGRIIRNVMIPHFKTGDYDAGISAGVEAILASLQGSYTAPAEEESSADLGTKLMAGGIFLVVVGLFTTIVLFTKGAQAWFLYFFLLPFWLMFPIAIIGIRGGAIAFGCYALFTPLFRLWWSKSAGGKAFHTRISAIPFFGSFALRAYSAGGGSSSSSGGSSFSSSSDSFSGGGGGFSGGGASGGW